MKTVLRRSFERGSADYGWLKTHYSFSFADYYDPRQMGFGVLRVINEDRIAGSAGFPMHGHRDMEILTYIVEGALSHSDSMGNNGVIRTGEIQQMSAGTGVRHSEFNASGEESVHLLQIWIVPDKAGYQPKYDLKNFSVQLASSDPVLLASRGGRDGSTVIYQDVDLFAVRSKTAGKTAHALKAGRGLWLQVIRGDVKVAGIELAMGDGLGLVEIDSVDLSWGPGAEFLIFDLVV